MSSRNLDFLARENHVLSLAQRCSNKVNNKTASCNLVVFVIVVLLWLNIDCPVLVNFLDSSTSLGSESLPASSAQTPSSQ